MQGAEGVSDDSKPAREWLKGKTAADFDLIEQGGRIYFPDVVYRLRKGGKFEEVPVAVCVPRPYEKAMARLRAIKLAADWKIDREKDADHFETLDTFSVLSQAIRTREPPHGQFQPVEWLLSTKEDEGFDERSLWAIWERVKAYGEIMDPRITEPNTEEVIAAAVAIDRVRNLSPLVAIAGSAVDSFVVEMATILCGYLRQRPSAPSDETSTPVH